MKVRGNHLFWTGMVTRLSISGAHSRSAHTEGLYDPTAKIPSPCPPPRKKQHQSTITCTEPLFVTTSMGCYWGHCCAVALSELSCLTSVSLQSLEVFLALIRK